MGFRDLVGGLLGAPDSKMVRADPTLPVVRPTLTQAAQWSQWDSDKAIQEGLKSSIYVYRGVTMNAKAASSVPWKAYMKPRGHGSKREPVPEHDLEKILTKPMAGMDIRPRLNGADLFESLYGYLFLAGKSGIFLEGLRRDGRFTNMRTMMPHRMHPVLEKNRGIVLWQYDVDSAFYPVPAEQVWYTRFPDPASEWDGLAPLMAMARLVDTDVESVNHNWWTLKNQAVVAGALIHKGYLSEQDKQANKREWQSNYGGRKRGATPILSGEEWNYIQMGMSPQQLLLVEQRRQTAVELSLGLGIPPELMGLEKTYANFGQARKAWWEDTLVPLIDDTKTAINDDLAPRWDDRLEIEPDYSNIPALQEDRDAKEKRILARVAGGIMRVDKAQEELGLDPDPTAAIYLQPYHQIATPDYSAVPQTPPAGAIATPAAPPDPVQAKPKSAPGHERKAIDPLTEAGRIAYWAAWDAIVRRMGGALGQQVWTELSLELELFLKALGTDAIPLDWEVKLEEVMTGARPRWVATLAGADMATVQEFGPPAFAALQAEAKALGVLADVVPQLFDPYDQAIQQYIARHVAENVAQIEETTRQGIKRVVGEAWSNGDTILELAANMSAMPEVSMSRGEMIAITETTAMANYASLAAAAQSGAPAKKRWLSSRDARVRETHGVADKMYSDVGIPLNQPFQVGNSYLMHPGDSSLGAQAKEVVRCRCTLVYTVEVPPET